MNPYMKLEMRREKLRPERTPDLPISGPDRQTKSFRLRRDLDLSFFLLYPSNSKQRDESRVSHMIQLPLSGASELSLFTEG
jgi:hypothetical protein